MSEEKLKKVIEDAFDEASVGYDRPAMRFFDNSATALATRLPLTGNEHVLDAATGTGKVALALANRCPQGRITGIDLSAGMLKLAQTKAEQSKLTNLSFQQVDVDRATFPAGSFDGLTCGFGVHFWSNMEQSLSHLLKSIKKGGFVAITSFAKGSFEPHSDMCLKRFSEFGVRLPDSYSLERLNNQQKNTDLLNKVGLSDIHVEENQVGYFLSQAADWWDLVLFTGYRAFLNQLTADQTAQFKKIFLGDVESTKIDKGIFLDVKVITAISRV